MYGEIREYLDSNLGELLVTAIISHNHDNMEVGLPCLLDFTKA